MYKVMIVDDETLIISLIQNLIDWGKYDMAIGGIATNGIDALAEVERIQPDIVIVDVRMPGYDGITFMQKVREMNTRIKFIVISGHKKFEYAKSAMKYNVEDYLIKPICKEELEHILEKLKEKLAIERQSEDSRQELSSKLTASRMQLRDYFTDAFFHNKFKQEELLEDKVNESYFVHFKGESYCGVVLKLDAKHTNLDAGFTEKLLGRMKEHLLKAAEDVCYEILVCPAIDALYVICNYPEKSQRDFICVLKEVYMEIEAILKKFEDILLTIGVGMHVNKLSEANASIDTAGSCIWARLALGTGKLIFHSDLKEDTGIPKNILTDTVIEKWNDAIRSLQIDKVRIQVQSALSYAEEYKYQDNLIYQKVTEALEHTFYDYINKIDLCRKPYAKFREELNEKACWAFTGQMLAEAIIAQMNGYIAQYASEDSKDCSPAIRIVKKYIAENFKTNISMASMAELVNLSPVYFSVLFKREAGTNFLDYLNQYRLEMSKKLLRQVQYNVNEVAIQSGFQDAKYFSKLFKKTFGITPTEYRNRNVE